ncbi:nuclear transport factor 2 family protein [Spirosoma sp. KCTC 42546]|uniref:nuclear transport factor 2 family protein n=1 Tax=Spirosoma sp. KCTC 42546 TaxID=2520506 RepID=UPI001158DD81|nr:nuclear transport factor 2 family protein [Spirosoma sp. KCTC 42546]QDK81895.1 nuclear transport factor 2 family protein [Spirosoma sp. KCTC 42546]
MAIPRHLIEVVYGVFSDNNLSRILPVLDEKIVLYIAENGPAGNEYHGRSGFLTMMSSLYTICENLSVHSLVYFMPENDPQQNAVITTGFFEGKLLADNEPAVVPFVHCWQIKDDRVVELRAFSWDSAKLLNRLQQANRGPNLPPNGHSTANGSNLP